MAQNKINHFGIMPYATNNYDNEALAQLVYIVCHYGIKLSLRQCLKPVA
jgi:hypothetical protein